MSRARESARDGAAPLYLSFDDNVRLGALFGEHDRNLARIEEKLGVWVTSRGNRLAIAGPADATGRARGVLVALYDMLGRGEPVGPPEVDGALRMARGIEPGDSAPPPASADETVISTRQRRIRPRSPAQAAYVRALRESTLVFGVGPAGTGKTYLAVAVAVAMLARGAVERIVLSRPAVESGERLGFLPGDVQEKVDPYFRPLYDAFHDMMPAERVIDHLRSGQIEIAPLAFMRGRTLSNAFVILDEGQNTTPVQMKMFLTRIGENARMAVTGDLTQIDLPASVRSGLSDALEVTHGLEEVRTVRFSEADVVRHDLVTRIVRAYSAREARSAPGAGAAPEAEARA